MVLHGHLPILILWPILYNQELLLQEALEIPQDKNPRRLAEFNKCVFLIETEYLFILREFFKL
jgi:hypothetical protein